MSTPEHGAPLRNLHDPAQCFRCRREEAKQITLKTVVEFMCDQLRRDRSETGMGRLQPLWEVEDVLARSRLQGVEDTIHTEDMTILSTQVPDRPHI